MQQQDRAGIGEVLERLKANELEPPVNKRPPARVNPIQPPAFGAPQRDAIASIVDGVVDDFCRRIQTVRETLDRIEQQALQSAASAKGALNDHITICVKLNDEIKHMGAVADEIAGQMMKSTE